MMENENKSFNISISSEIVVADHGICDGDLREEIKMIVKPLLLFFFKAINMMKHVDEVKAGKTG